jgi:hypothetical protein
MKGKQIGFFATQSDLGLLDASFEGVSIQYMPTDVLDPQNLQIVFNLSNLAPFKSYLVCEAGKKVTLRTIEQDDGRIRSVADQVQNPGTALLHLGGLLAADRLLPGSYGTLGSDAAANVLYEVVVKRVKKTFERVKTYFVGPEAANLLDKGARLMQTSKSPATFDLKR